MVTRTARQVAVRQSVRRLNPLHDLGQVASVMEEGFGPDLTEVGQRALREMRLLSRLGPFLWWLVSTSPEFREYHSGFVWVEEGRVVGTLHITRPSSYARWWLISNVAVRVKYRRRGIARALMETALAWAREQGGEAAFLRVRQDNVAAWSLYKSFGFQPLHDTVDLLLAQVTPVQKAVASELTLSPYQPGQWRQVRELARAIVPSDLGWLESVPVADFQLSLERRLVEWWAGLTTGRRTCRLVALRGKQLVAAMAVKVAGQRGSHSLLLHVHPSHRGKVEEVLVTEALSRLWPHRHRPTVVVLPISYDEIVNVLEQYGFVRQRTLTLMRRSLQVH